ncbi:MAG TPA: IS110 family transposase [Anaerolineae bacterium]
MTLAILGLDLAKEKMDAFLLQATQASHRTFANTPHGFAQLQQWLTRHRAEAVHACLEATGTYGDDVALFLHEQGHTVSMVNPAQIKAYGESELSRNKTDKGDAALIARFCQSQQPRTWTPPSPQVRELQALLRRRESLQEMHQQEANRLASGVRAEAVRTSIQETLAFLDAEIAKIERQIHDHINQHPDLKAQQDLIASIKGIGPKTAALFIAEYPDLKAFASARAMVAFAGLNPQHHDSGRSIHGKPRLSKKGAGRLRKGLYWPAIVAMRYNPVLQAFADRLLAHGKPKMVVIAAVMRKLIHLVYGVLKSGQPFDPNYAKIGA